MLITERPMGPDGRPFAWGAIERIHTIGDFAVVEGRRTEPISNSTAPDKEVGRISFHAYVRNDNTRHSFGTLDEALAFCLAYKYDPAASNTKAHTYFMRAITAMA